MTLFLHGETVQVTQIICSNRGNFKEYKAVIKHNGIPVGNKPVFKEHTASCFRRAGWRSVEYSYAKVIKVPSIDVVIEDVNNRYQITAVYAADGTVHKVDVSEEDRKKQRNEDRLRAVYSEDYNLAVYMFALGHDETTFPPVRKRVIYKKQNRWHRTDGKAHIRRQFAPRGTLYKAA